MSQWDSLMSTGDSTSGGRFQIDYNGLNQLRFLVAGGTITDNLTANEWSHIVLTKSDNATDDKKVCLFKNGYQSGTCVGSLITHWDKLKIGLNRSNSAYWKGFIDEIKIYNKTFSAQDVLDLYQSY